MTITKKDVEEFVHFLEHQAEQDRHNHGAGRQVQKAYEDRAEGLDIAIGYLRSHFLPKAERKYRKKVYV